MENLKKFAKTLVFLAILQIFTNLESAISQVKEEWVSRFNGAANRSDQAYAIALDKSGNVYVTGGARENSINQDFITIKYNPDGQIQWKARYQSPTNGVDIGRAIVVDDSGYVYVTGESFETGKSYDFATIKYNQSGDSVWVKRLNGGASGVDYPKAIAVDDSGNVCVTGYNDMGATNDDYTTVKYNSHGDLVWINRYDGTGSG